MKHVAFLAAMLSSAAAFAEDRQVVFISNGSYYVSAEGGGGGALHANRPTHLGLPGAWETFLIRDLNGGSLISSDQVCLQTDNGHFVVAEGGGGDIVNANSTACGLWEQFRIFKLAETSVAGLFEETGSTIPGGIDDLPAVGLQAANGNWVAAEGGGSGLVNATRPELGSADSETCFLLSLPPDPLESRVPIIGDPEVVILPCPFP